MNVFTDYHHRDALDSLYRLFEGRFGMKLYVPSGIEYYDHGDLAIHDGDDDRSIIDGLCVQYPKTSQEGFSPISQTSEHRYPIRYIPFEHFNDIKFDIFLPTLPSNVRRFKRLAERNNPKAKMIFRAGNNWVNRPWDTHPVNNLLLASIGTFICGMQPLFVRVPYERREELYRGYHWVENTPIGRINACYMHSEFNTELFRPEWDKKDPTYMTSLMNVLDAENSDYLISLCDQLKWKLKIFGAGNRDQILSLIEDEATELQAAGFLGHLKQTDDGYGFNIHRGAYCGCQIITRSSYYRGRFFPNLYSSACLLFEDDTFIDVDRGLDYVLSELKHRSSHYREYYENSIRHARRVIDFDEEEKKIRVFMENLV